MLDRCDRPGLTEEEPLTAAAPRPAEGALSPPRRATAPSFRAVAATARPGRGRARAVTVTGG